MAATFRSKVDTWLYVLMAVMAGVLLSVAWRILQERVPGLWALALFLVAVGVVLPVSLLFSTSYTLDGTTLLVRSSFFTWRIPVAEITGLERTNDPLSSPALSFDRLRISYGNGQSLMISPRDQTAFLEALLKLAPGLTAPR